MKIEVGGSLLPVGLFLLFLGLKLAHVIDWRWLWIFAPLWAPVMIILIPFTLAGVAFCFYLICKFIIQKNADK